MQEDLITPYGTLKFLPRDEISELNLDLERFEESSELTLAPFLLDETFLKILETRLTADDTAEEINEKSNELNSLWAIIYEGRNNCRFPGFFPFIPKIRESSFSAGP